jgi:hypothetical protein
MTTEIKNIISKITNWIHLNKNLVHYTKADYFNGSSNDAENIFIELKKLITDGHCHHSRYFYERLNFLINEGIDVASGQTAAFKAVAATEAVTLKTKKVTETKKVIKTKKAVKKAYKPKRDRNGRFIAKKRL